jgi:hypothetical protein
MRQPAPAKELPRAAFLQGNPVPVALDHDDVVRQWQAAWKRRVGVNLGPGPDPNEQVDERLLLLRDGRWLGTVQVGGNPRIEGEFLPPPRAAEWLVRHGLELPQELLSLLSTLPSAGEEQRPVQAAPTGQATLPAPSPPSEELDTPAAPEGPREDQAEAGRSFIPTDLQERILEALNGKALTLDALAEKLDHERSSLHRDGLKELMRRGLVRNNRRAGGYYRPDAPPPKYADRLGQQPGDMS